MLDKNDKTLRDNNENRMLNDILLCCQIESKKTYFEEGIET